MIGIVAAMELEAARLLEAMEDVETRVCAALDYHTGRLRGKRVALCQCGVGMVNAALHTQILLDRWPISAVLHTGVAGSISPEARYMDLIVGEALCYHDMQDWVTEQYGPMLRGCRSDPALVRLALDCARTPCRVGTIATGQLFVSDPAAKADIAARTGAVCVEMESCAVAQTAALAGVPFVVLRSISDMADGGAPEDFSAFAGKAADVAAALVMDMVARLEE